MNKYLIVVNGFFGDIAFSSSIAKELKIKNECVVDYLIRFNQMKSLLEYNPYIDNVYVGSTPKIKYDRVINIGQFSFEIPPPMEAKLMANIENPDSSYKIYTSIEYDVIAEKYISDLPKEKTLAIMSNWKEKTYIFTEQQYIAGVDVPNLGYGGSHRNIEYIIQELNKHYNILMVGFNQNVSQQQTMNIEDNDTKSLLFECSLMKFCDWFIGTEGGLANLAAGVGTNTIITGDFVHQLYGWNGVIKKIKEPKLGPKYYDVDGLHITIDPYLSDKEVLYEIISEVN